MASVSQHSSEKSKPEKSKHTTLGENTGFQKVKSKDSSRVKTPDKVVIYARVSSRDQKGDLERQVEYLKNYCSAKGYQVAKIITDISSGLNENRKGLKQLFKLVESGEVTKVVITNKDRLTRFGFKYLEQYFNSHGVEIEVILDDEEKIPEKELVEDLLAIVTSFAGKLYGMRSHKKKRLVEAVKNVLRDD